MRICFHSHCFPDALAPRAIQSLTQNAAPFGFYPHTDGTADGAMTYLRAAGVDRALICSIATNSHQQKKVNDFAVWLQQHHPFFYATGSLHPDGEGHEAELDRLTAAGIRGIKIHPDYVGIPITDPRFDRIFSMLEERGMFVVSHTGFDPVSPHFVHAAPHDLLSVIERHPRLMLIAAHMGGTRCSAAVLRSLAGTPIYLDTALSAVRPDEWDNLYRILELHDPARVLFGTDTPWSFPAEEIAFIERAPLSPAAREMIFEKNAKRLLGIDELK